MSSDKENDSKSRIEEIAAKATKEGIKAGIKVSKFIKNTLDEVREERENSTSFEDSKKSLVKEEIYTTPSKSKTTGHALEKQIDVWQGWFWGTVVYVSLIIISFMIATTDTRFRLLPWVLAIGFPFYAFKALINSIPEIKFGNNVVFSKKDITIRDQLSFSSTVFRVFSKELFRNNPKGAAILTIFTIFLLYVLLSPFFA